MDSAYNDALVGRYPSSVVNLRASFETHLVMEKLMISTDDEFSAWLNHKDPQNENTFKIYWKIFRPGAIMETLPEGFREKYKRVYYNVSPYSHAGVKSALDNIVVEASTSDIQTIAFSPVYQKGLTERQLKDLLVIMWLNGSTISRIFEDRIPIEISKKSKEWGDKLESIGTFA